VIGRMMRCVKIASYQADMNGKKKAGAKLAPVSDAILQQCCPLPK